MTSVNLRKFTVLSIIFLISFGIFSVQPVLKESKVDNGMNNSISDNIIILNSEKLTSNLYARNITVDKGAVLTTNGYSIFANGSFVNYGTVDTGYSSPSNYPKSYGGSGGGAQQVNQSRVIGSSGYNTIAPGGKVATTAQNGSNGETPALPVLTISTLEKWNTTGLSNFLSGAAGESTYGTGQILIKGGLGGNGIYIQAINIINHGNIIASGQEGIGTGQGGLSGGGGGGVILLAYNQSLTLGYIDASGGAGAPAIATVLGSPVKSGNGGSGQVLYFHYTGSGLPKSNSGNNVLYLFIGIPIAVALILITMAYMSYTRAKDKNESDNPLFAQNLDKAVIEGRIDELRGLLDRGIIDSRIYEESVKRLRGQK